MVVEPLQCTKTKGRAGVWVRGWVERGKERLMERRGKRGSQNSWRGEKANAIRYAITRHELQPNACVSKRREASNLKWPYFIPSFVSLTRYCEHHAHLYAFLSACTLRGLRASRLNMHSHTMASPPHLPSVGQTGDAALKYRGEGRGGGVSHGLRKKTHHA